EAVVPWITQLEDEDLQGLSSESILRRVQELVREDPASVTNSLMERLSTVEAELLARTASEPSPPVLDAERSVGSLKRLRFERQRAAVQREIDRLQAIGDAGPALMD